MVQDRTCSNRNYRQKASGVNMQLFSLVTLSASAPLLINAALTTLYIWFAASCISIIVGTLTGLLRAHALRIPLASLLLDGITLILRGIPLYAQLMIIYFILPEVSLINLSSENASIIGLGLCSAAYVSETVRAGINALPTGQWDASFVLGYSPLQQLRFIVLPQAFRSILPSLMNEYNMALKSTAIVASIGTVELTKTGMNIIARSAEPLTITLAIAFIYLVLTGALSLIGQLLERKYYVNR